MKRIFLLAVLLSGIFNAYAQVDSAKLYLDSLEAQFRYQHGEIKFENGIGTLVVPNGFRFLNAEQSRYILEDVWGNPKDTLVMGMIVPETRGMLEDNSWAFIITYEQMGYVEDDDADDIDYDELLETLQNDATAENEARVREGYQTIQIVGWASKPYYDSEKKVLHWAKEIKFGDNELNTLNYNVRVLGRKGVLVLNAVSSMNELPEVQKSITPVLSSFTYAEGSSYKDFNPDIDEVAAWTIGGLVAGKMLAKVGLLAIFLKYIKIILLAVAGVGAGAWKWYKRKTEAPMVRNVDGSANS